MKEQELRDALHYAADGCQLSEYRKRQILAQMKGEEPVKKKLTVSVVLVMVIMLLTLSVAAALVHSTIVEQLFGSSENAPVEVSERIQMPQATVESPLGTLSLDEWFYDGQAIHTAFSIANPTGESLFYTLEGIELNGQPVTYNRLRTEGAGDSGFLLGGAVDGTPMPASVSLYNQGDELHTFDENGKYTGRMPLPEGTATLKISAAVWKPVGAVELIDDDRYEGVNITETKDHLTVNDKGFSQLWLFRPEEYNLSYNASQSGAQVYQDAYKELGWMELLDTIEVETTVHLSKEQAVRAVPESMEYEQEAYRLKLEQFDYSHAGGRLSARMYGDADTIHRFLSPHGFRLVDLESRRILNNVCYWDEQSDKLDGMLIGMTLLPVAGDLPEKVYFVPVTGYNESWDENAHHYEPDLEKPENVIEGWTCDLEHAVAIQLKIIP